MKKFSFTFLCLLMISLAAFSQTKGFGIKAGITTNYLKFTQNDETIEGQKIGFYLGVLNHLPLDKNFALQPNFQVALKGAKLPGIEFTTWHLELPVNLLYTHNGFYVGGGPYISYGLDGKAKGEDLQPDGEVDIYSKAETPDYLFRRLEGGVNLLMGYTFPGGISLNANFSHGLNNLYRGTGNNKITSKTFGFSIAYLLGKK